MAFCTRSFKNYSDALCGILCLVIAITLQIQITLFESPTYLGLRINLTDILAPVAALAILVSLLRKKSLWPQWQMAHIYRWIFAITALFLFGVINSYLNYSQISQWGLTNKFGGWIILATILGIGGWIGTNVRQIHLQRFIQIMFYAALTILLVQIVVMVVQSYQSTRSWLPYNKYVAFPIAGMMANRNAYALFIMGLVAIATCFHLSNYKILKPFFVRTLYFLLPFYVVFNGSRTAFFVLSLMVVAIIAVRLKHHKKRCFLLLLSLIAGISTFAGIYHDKRDQLHYIKKSMYEVIVEAKKDIGKDNVLLTDIGTRVTNPGDSMRLTILQDSIEMAGQHPIIGSGLGSVFFFQEKKYGEIVNLIDCTPLWLLVETGAIGLILFALFYFRILKTVVLSLKTDEEFTQTLRMAILFIIGGFTLMCLLHEIMYTRHMWFLIGLGLTLPSKMRQDG